MEVGGERSLLDSAYVFSLWELFDPIVERHQVEAVVVTHELPDKRRFSLALLGRPDWALVHLDHFYAVFLRRVPRWQEAIADHEISESEVMEKLARARKKEK